MELKIRTAPLFEVIAKTNAQLSNVLNYEPSPKAIESENGCIKFVVSQGGGDAGKTITLLQILFFIAREIAKSKILIAAATMPSLKDGAISSYEKYVKDDFLPYISKYNDTDKIVYFTNGSKVKFKSYEKENIARGQEWDYIFFNEANNFNYELVWQLQRKCNFQVFFDYNPTSLFWVHTQFLNSNTEFKGQVFFTKTDHRHNPFLSQKKHDSYENLKDPNLFKVYARGETGIVKGIIFRATEIKHFPTDCEKIIWGVDYGYTTDPTCIMKIGIKGNARYIQECMYTPCEDPEIIYNTFIAAGWQEGQLIFAEHDKEINYKLISKGLQTLYLANKKNKIANVAIVKRFDLYYTESSKNYKSEVEAYKWTIAKNLTTGEDVEVAILQDGNDHAIDAKMYAIATHTRSFEN